MHRDVLERDGVNFIAHRGEQGKEFLASTDMWFRPTNFVTGPDGNLYLTDMHRETIEQPESIPEELKKNIDFMSGSDKGRIFRISPVHPLRQRDLKPKLEKPAARSWWNYWPAPAAGTARRRIGFSLSGKTGRWFRNCVKWR